MNLINYLKKYMKVLRIIATNEVNQMKVLNKINHALDTFIDIIGDLSDSPSYQDRPAWELDFEEKLTPQDFEELGVEKDKLYHILQQLYEWKIIR